MKVRSHITSMFKNATKKPFCGTITNFYSDSVDKIYVVRVESENGDINYGLAVDCMGLIRANPPKAKQIEFCFIQEDGIPIAFSC